MELDEARQLGVALINLSNNYKFKTILSIWHVDSGAECVEENHNTIIIWEGDSLREISICVDSLFWFRIGRKQNCGFSVWSLQTASH